MAKSNEYLKIYNYQYVTFFMIFSKFQLVFIQLIIGANEKIETSFSDNCFFQLVLQFNFL